MDIRNGKAQLPFLNAEAEPVYVSMISARDAARLVVAALALPNWPMEWRMQGDRMAVTQIVELGEQLRGK